MKLKNVCAGLALVFCMTTGFMLNSQDYAQAQSVKKVETQKDNKKVDNKKDDKKNVPVPLLLPGLAALGAGLSLKRQQEQKQA